MSDADLLNKAIDSAKSFENFSEVLMAVSLHPEWLTVILEDRIWAILHQTIFSGNIPHLDQLLALQKSNKRFRLLTDTQDKQTILDIASLRQDTPEMIEHLKRLIKLDEMLTYARDCVWDRCYEIVTENPSYANEKPPYRRFYLIHHMACANAQKQYERFKQIKNCVFDLTLRADRKKINVIAREEGKPAFATFIEEQCPALLEQDDPDLDDLYQPSPTAIKQTSKISAVMVQQNIIKDLDHGLMGDSYTQKNRGEVLKQISAIRIKHDKEHKHSDKPLSKDDEAKRKEQMLDNLTCPLTLAVFVEPAVAADGFTYEHSAIKKWLEKNDRSPMTNKPLSNKDLNPNHTVKRIINALQTKS